MDPLRHCLAIRDLLDCLDEVCTPLTVSLVLGGSVGVVGTFADAAVGTRLVESKNRLTKNPQRLSLNGEVVKPTDLVRAGVFVVGKRGDRVALIHPLEGSSDPYLSEDEVQQIWRRIKTEQRETLRWDLPGS